MDILSLVQDEEVKQIIIEKKDVVNERTENNECLIDMQLSIRVVYHEECVRRSSIIRVGKYLEHWLYDLKRHELKASTFDRKEQVVKNQIIPYIGAHVFATRKGYIQGMLTGCFAVSSKNVTSKVRGYMRYGTRLQVFFCRCSPFQDSVFSSHFTSRKHRKPQLHEILHIELCLAVHPLFHK